MFKKILISSILFFSLLISFSVKANVINDCTNEIYNDVYSTLSPYEKQQISQFDVNIVNDELNNYKNILKNKNDIILGLTDCGNKTIYVSNKYKNYNASRILYHETFHAINYAYIKSTSQAEYPNGKIEYFDSSHFDIGYYSNTKEFIDIFNEEKKNICLYSNEKYFLSDVQEYFAECGAIYHMNSDKLKRLAPRTHEYLTGIINQEVKENKLN